MSKSRPELGPIPDIPYYDYVFRDAEKHKDRIALIDVVTEKSYTYAETQQTIRKVACSLAAAGVTKNSVFSIFAPNSPEYVIVYFAAQYIGAVTSVINCLYTERELLYHIDDNCTEFIICGAGMEPNVIQASKKQGRVKRIFTFGAHSGCHSYSSLVQNGQQSYCSRPSIKSEDDVVIPYSSGTTGRAKGVVLTNRNMVVICVLLSSRYPSSHFDAQQGPDTILVYQPLSHIYGSMVTGYGLASGRTVVIFPRFDFERFLQSISKYKPRTLTLVPPIAVLMTKHPLTKKYDLSSLEEVACGAAALSKETEDDLRQLMPGVKVFQGYGMTETSGISHMLDYKEEKRGSIGRACAGTEAKVVHVETGRDLGPKEEGEIWTRGPHIMKSYLNKPEATASTVDKDGWLRTGDVGYQDKDGYFYVVDRIKDLIKVKGYQVAPVELEAVILTKPEVADVGVIGIPDSESGEAPLALVVRKPGTTLTQQQVMDFVAAQVAPFKRLRGGVRFVAEIPTNPSGKILRREMKRLLKLSKI